MSCWQDRRCGANGAQPMDSVGAAAVVVPSHPNGPVAALTSCHFSASQRCAHTCTLAAKHTPGKLSEDAAEATLTLGMTIPIRKQQDPKVRSRSLGGLLFPAGLCTRWCWRVALMHQAHAHDTWPSLRASCARPADRVWHQVGPVRRGSSAADACLHAPILPHGEGRCGVMALLAPLPNWPAGRSRCPRCTLPPVDSASPPLLLAPNTCVFRELMPLGGGCPAEAPCLPCPRPTARCTARRPRPCFPRFPCLHAAKPSLLTPVLHCSAALPLPALLLAPGQPAVTHHVAAPPSVQAGPASEQSFLTARMRQCKPAGQHGQPRPSMGSGRRTLPQLALLRRCRAEAAGGRAAAVGPVGRRRPHST